MSAPEQKLKELGSKLPNPTKLPDGLHLPFSCVNQVDDRLLIFGHPRNDASGSIVSPSGRLEPT